MKAPRPFVRTRVFFGPVPRAKTVRQELLGKAGGGAFASMICGVHHADANEVACPLGVNCLCKAYISPAQKDVVEL